jgi:hypothetical protein
VSGERLLDKGWPPTRSESCVVGGDVRSRRVDSELVGRVIEGPEIRWLRRPTPSKRRKATAEHRNGDGGGSPGARMRTDLVPRFSPGSKWQGMRAWRPLELGRACRLHPRNAARGSRPRRSRRGFYTRTVSTSRWGTRYVLRLFHPIGHLYCHESISIGSTPLAPIDLAPRAKPRTPPPNSDRCGWTRNRPTIDKSKVHWPKEYTRGREGSLADACVHADGSAPREFPASPWA